MKLTIGIKALNEEHRIAACIESAVAAARRWDGEVVLADSGSTDRTVEIARAFPIRIVQLANRHEKSCGAGAQLAFQRARGEYFYLLDGDMELKAGFVDAAIAYLDGHPAVAGVGGRLREMNVENEGFRINAAAREKQKISGDGIVDRLDGGGLYRATAVRESGYFADRNLHGFEEFELAARLRCKGWVLVRLDRVAIDHHGHRAGGYGLLWRRVRTGYAGGVGEVLRSAIGRPQLPAVLRGLGHIRNGFAVMLWWALCLACLLLPATWTVRIGVLFLLVALPLAGLAIRRKSLGLGLYSLASWNVNAIGLVTGFFRKRASPRLPLAAVELSAPDIRV